MVATAFRVGTLSITQDPCQPTGIAKSLSCFKFFRCSQIHYILM